MLMGVGIGSAAPITVRARVAVDSVYICQSKSAYAYHAYICRSLGHCTHGIVRITKPRQSNWGISLAKSVIEPCAVRT